MGTVRYKLDLNKPPELSAETLARLDALTPEEIEENARNDPDNPPLTDEELNQVRVARFVQGVRRGRGMTQSTFATTYGIALARLRDWEQGRWQPDAMALAYLTTIAHEPEAVARALEKQRATA